METTKNDIYDSFRPKMSMSAWVKTIVPTERHKEVFEALYAYADKEGIKLPALKTKIVNLDVAKNIASLVYKVMGEEAPKSEVKNEDPVKTDTKKKEVKKTTTPSDDLKFAEGTSEWAKEDIREMVSAIGHKVPDWVIFTEGKTFTYPDPKTPYCLTIPEEPNHISHFSLNWIRYDKPEFDKLNGVVTFESVVSNPGYYGNAKEFFNLTKAIKEALGLELPSGKSVADNVYDYNKFTKAIKLLVDGFMIVDADVKSNIKTLKEVVGGSVKSAFERMAEIYADRYRIDTSDFLSFVKKTYTKKIKTSVGSFTFLTAYSKYPQCIDLCSLVYFLVKEYNKK